ncbi:MAG: glycosyl transferase family 2 [Conexibacter sp.]|nr:glycosyl transferase family 2 [Conexibacter sp.]
MATSSSSAAAQRADDAGTPSRLAGSTPVPVLYLAPWVDYGGSDKGTIDWFRWIDRDRFAPSLICTQPSENRRLSEVEPYAREVWSLPDLMPGESFAPFIFDFIDSRDVEVVHIMNSRLAFELLPDLASLRRPPRVVVQLHVEEQTRDGYVRYVTTRYGNLVDAFSVTSEHLAAVVEGYDVPRDKVHVIHTGVDAEREFSPEHVAPVEGLGDGGVEILYPGRLCQQKDPFLMVEVAAALRQATEERFRIHVVGDGELEQQVRERVRARGLEQHVRFHPPTREIGRWYAAADVMLMTSVFEGVPYVVYEAMAMGLPIVAPALSGNVELLGAAAPGLIEPRDDVSGYVEELHDLVRDAGLRRATGERLRERAGERFSLRRMADEHAALYERVLQERPLPTEPEWIPSLPAPIRFRTRPALARPLVSVIVPCFNHGRYLRACLDSVAQQTYPSIETIVVDDGSTDRQTVALLDEIEAAGPVTVLRQRENAGPSAARNAAIDIVRGRYVLPVDADNTLVPTAVADLVVQLQAAGEQVGFVYPNLQFFGNRNDYFEPPEYSVYGLLHGNFCDTSSLFDREIFDAGLRFDETIRLGHEDWDFVLTLAEHGIHGERANAKTLLYRKHGFSRADLVDHGQEPFHDAIRERHPALYGRRRFRHPQATLRARWAPKLSLVALHESRDVPELRRLAAQQTCADFELIAFATDELERLEQGARLRRIPSALTASTAERLVMARAVAHGDVLLATYGSGADLLRRPDFVEKLLRLFGARDGLAGIAFTEARPASFGWQPIEQDADLTGGPFALAWRPDQLPASPSLRDGEELVAILRAITTAGGVVDWRGLPTSPRPRPPVNERMVPVTLPAAPPPRLRSLHDPQTSWPAALPAMRGDVRRWHLTPTYVPPLIALLCRHREASGEGRIVTNDRRSPPGYVLEHTLGGIRTVPFAGTAPIYATADGALVAGSPGSPELADATLVGHAEQAAFPLLSPLALVRHPATGALVPTAGDDPLRGDPAFADAEPVAVLGFVELFPLEPRVPRVGDRLFGVDGLVRVVDGRLRRHRYAVGGMPSDGVLAGELGALYDWPAPDTEPLWISPTGAVSTEGYRPVLPTVSAFRAAKWTLAPFRWNGPWPLDARARGAARRALQGARMLRKPAAAPNGSGERPLGYVLREGGAGRVALYASIHPITHDQLLTTHLREAIDLGYEDPTVIGHLIAIAPTTGRLGPLAVAIPWASRFGTGAPRG